MQPKHGPPMNAMVEQRDPLDEEAEEEEEPADEEELTGDHDPAMDPEAYPLKVMSPEDWKAADEDDHEVEEEEEEQAEIVRRNSAPDTSHYKAVGEEIRIRLGDMTPREAEDLTYRIQHSETERRISVYLIWKHEGWKLLKTPTTSFKSWCEERIDTSHDTAYNWCSQVQATIDAKSLTARSLGTFEEGILLPQTVTRLLSQLESAEQRRAVYKDISEMRSYQASTERELLRNLATRVKALTQKGKSDVPRLESAHVSVSDSNSAGVTAPTPRRPDIDRVREVGSPSAQAHPGNAPPRPEAPEAPPEAHTETMTVEAQLYEACDEALRYIKTVDTTWGDKDYAKATTVYLKAAMKRADEVAEIRAAFDRHDRAESATWKGRHIP